MLTLPFSLPFPFLLLLSLVATDTVKAAPTRADDADHMALFLERTTRPFYGSDPLFLSVEFELAGNEDRDPQAINKKGKTVVV